MVTHKPTGFEEKSLEEEDEDENEFWWRKGIIQAPRCIVRWNHTDEGRQSRGIAEKGRKVTWSELFLDLILVTNVALIGEAYQSGALSLLQCLVIYRLIYSCWWATTSHSSMFYTDDLVDKYSNGLMMFLLVCAGLRIGEEFGFVAAGSNVARSSAWYHVVTTASSLRVYLAIPHARTFVMLLGVALNATIAVACWAAPALFGHSDAELLVALVVVVLIEPTWVSVLFNVVRLPKKRRVPVHVDHVVERRGCLRLILFGEVITGVTVAPAPGPLTVANLAPIALAFIIVLNLKLLAFDVDVVPIKRHCYRVAGVKLGFARPIVFMEAAFFFDATMALLGSCVKIVLTLMLGAASSGETTHESESDIDEAALPPLEVDAAAASSSSGGLAAVKWARANQAHVLLSACVGFGVLFLTIERLMHDQRHIFGDDHWFYGSSKKAAAANGATRTAPPSAKGGPYTYAAVSQTGTESPAAPNASTTTMTTTHREEAPFSSPNLADRRIFLLQMATHVGVIVVSLGLAAYCHHIDKDYEEKLVIAALAVLTSIAVFVNLVDEVFLVQDIARAQSEGDLLHDGVDVEMA